MQHPLYEVRIKLLRDDILKKCFKSTYYLVEFGKNLTNRKL